MFSTVLLTVCYSKQNLSSVQLWSWVSGSFHIHWFHSKEKQVFSFTNFIQL